MRCGRIGSLVIIRKSVHLDEYITFVDGVVVNSRLCVSVVVLTVV